MLSAAAAGLDLLMWNINIPGLSPLKYLQIGRACGPERGRCPSALGSCFSRSAGWAVTGSHTQLPADAAAGNWHTHAAQKHIIHVRGVFSPRVLPAWFEAPVSSVSPKLECRTVLCIHYCSWWLHSEWLLCHTYSRGRNTPVSIHSAAKQTAGREARLWNKSSRKTTSDKLFSFLSQSERKEMYSALCAIQKQCMQSFVKPSN